jgi:hypothetical protein
MDAVDFAEKWIAEHMRDNGGVDPAREVAKCKAELLAAGAAAGFTLSDFEDGLGDLGNYLQITYERVCGRTPKPRR